MNTDTHSDSSSASVATNTREPRNETRVDFRWSNRNFADGWWKTFYYCQGQGFNAGHKVYYGRNDWRTEADAIAAQERWERIRATSD